MTSSTSAGSMSEKDQVGKDEKCEDDSDSKEEEVVVGVKEKKKKKKRTFNNRGHERLMSKKKGATIDSLYRSVDGRNDDGESGEQRG